MIWLFIRKRCYIVQRLKVATSLLGQNSVLFHWVKAGKFLPYSLQAYIEHDSAEDQDREGEGLFEVMLEQGGGEGKPVLESLKFKFRVKASECCTLTNFYRPLEIV